MNFAEITDGVVTNIFVSEKPLYETWIEVGDTVAVRDLYVDGQFIKPEKPPRPPDPPPAKPTAVQILAKLTESETEKFVALLVSSGVLPKE